MNHIYARSQFFDFNAKGCYIFDFTDCFPSIHKLVTGYLLHELSQGILEDTLIVIPAIEDIFYKSRDREHIANQKSSLNIFIERILRKGILLINSINPADIDPSILANISNFIFFVSSDYDNQHLMKNICKIKKEQEDILLYQNELGLLRHTQSDTSILFKPYNFLDYYSTTCISYQAPIVTECIFRQPGIESLSDSEHTILYQLLDLLQTAPMSEYEIRDALGDLIANMDFSFENLFSFIHRTNYFSSLMIEDKEHWTLSNHGCTLLDDILYKLTEIQNKNFPMTTHEALNTLRDMDGFLRESNDLSATQLQDVVRDLVEIVALALSTIYVNSTKWDWRLVTLFEKLKVEIQLNDLKTLFSKFYDILTNIFLTEHEIVQSALTNPELQVYEIELDVNDTLKQAIHQINHLITSIDSRLQYPRLPLCLLYQYVLDQDCEELEMNFLETMDEVYFNNSQE